LSLHELERAENVKHKNALMQT